VSGRKFYLFSFFSLAALIMTAADSGGRVAYIGGTLQGLSESPEGSLDTTHEQYLFFRTRQLTTQVPYDRVNLLEYGQKVDRRLAMAVVVSPMFMLSKKRAHYLTLGYSDEVGRQQAMVFRVDKNDIRALLATLEARTGRKVTFQDEEARKSGKG
jgi:hypothetical protein